MRVERQKGEELGGREKGSIDMSERKGHSHHLWQNTAQKDDSNISTRHTTHAHTHTHTKQNQLLLI